MKAIINVSMVFFSRAQNQKEKPAYRAISGNDRLLGTMVLHSGCQDLDTIRSESVVVEAQTD